MAMEPRQGSIHVVPLHATIGAEVQGVDVGTPLDAATFGQIHAAWLRWAVLVFRGQRVTDEEQIVFSRHFGELEQTAIAGLGSNRHPEIYVLSNVGPDGQLLPPDDDRTAALTYNTLWHTDSSFKEVPSAGALLSARETPPEGGATEYADMRAAWDALPPARQAALDALRVVHNIRQSQPVNWGRLMTEEQRAAHPPAEHPLVRVHPDTGRRALYMGAHAQRVVGMEEAEGRALLTELVDWATAPRFVYRHVWGAGDLVLWDNRCTLHRGRPYAMTQHRRVMHRTTLAGQRAGS